MLTEEEKEELRREKCDAAYHCREIWGTLQTIRKIEKSYEHSHSLWKRRYETADRKLAEEEKLTKCPSPEEKKELAIILTKDQVMAIADTLGVEIDFEEEE